MIALVVDAQEREVYAHVRRVSPARWAITWETGATIEADAHEGVRGLVVADLPALQRAGALRVCGAQRRGEGREGQNGQQHEQHHARHARKVRRSDTELQSGGAR